MRDFGGPARTPGRDFESDPLVAVLGTTGDTVIDQIVVGQALQRSARVPDPTPAGRRGHRPLRNHVGGTADAVTDDLLDATRGRTVLLITHRRYGLDRVDRVVELAGAEGPAAA